MCRHSIESGPISQQIDNYIMKNTIRYIRRSVIAGLAVAGVVAMSSCADEIIYDGYVDAGSPVEVSVALFLPDAGEKEVLSRSVDGKLVNQIYDIMIFAFDQNGELAQRYFFRDLEEGVVACDPNVSTGSLASVVLPSSGGAAAGVLNMNVPAGRGYLMAVANIEIKSTSLLARLMEVKTRSELLGLYASDTHYDSDASILSGVYMEKKEVSMDEYEPSGEIVFRSGTMPGRIHLLSTTAAVKFNINGKGAGSKGGVFVLDSYELVNLPSRTPLFKEIGAPIAAEAPCITTGSLGVFEEVGANGYSFEFETLEYLATGKNIIRYPERAAWEGMRSDNPLYKNFVNAPAAAPYVILRGTYTGKSDYVDESGADKSGQVSADVSYYIFLGHDSGLGTVEGYNDFSTHRNWQYTYNITVNGVNDITVEVNREGNDHIRDDAEGDVVVMDTDSSHRFDSHYCQMEFKITMKEVREIYSNGLLGFRVIVPGYGVDSQMFLKKGSDGKYVNENSTGWGVHDDVTGALISGSTANHKKKGYMDLYNLACVSADWLRFYLHTSDDTAAVQADPVKLNYSDVVNKTDSGGSPLLLSIYRFLWKLKTFAESSQTSHPDSEELTFTVFVQENYYENNWNDRMVMNHGASGTSGNVDWSQFVNVSDRKVLLFPVTRFSNDDASSFSNPRRVFSQRSIRTIYNPVEGYKSWGVESLEEFIQPVTAPDWYKGSDWVSARRMLRIAEWKNSKRTNFSSNTSTTGTTSKYARVASYNLLKGKAWTTYLNYNSKYKNNLNYRISGNVRINTTSDYAATNDMISACLGRNRDLNGDGKIDAAEIRWYVPGISQLQALYVGNSGLPTEARLYQKEANEGKWVYKHYLSATRSGTNTTNSVLWAEEGCSTGAMNNSYAFGLHVRCVRDLGTDLSKAEEVWSGFYENRKEPSGNAAGYIDIDKLNVNCVRTALENKDLSGVVTTFSHSNRPAAKFYYARKIINTGPTKSFSYPNGTSYTVPDWTSSSLIRIDTENRKSESTPQLRSLCAQNFGQGWRTPTISEVAIMYWAGVFDINQHVMSRTRFVLWQQNNIGGIDLINNSGNDASGRDPHSFSEKEFRLRFPWVNVQVPTSTAAGNVTQISGHYGGILCVKDKL